MSDHPSEPLCVCCRKPTGQQCWEKPPTVEEILDRAAVEMAHTMKGVGCRFLTVELTPQGRASYMASPEAPKPGGEEEKLWLECTRWLLNECLGDSGTGFAHWGQFPQFRTLCAQAGITWEEEGK